MPGTIAYGQIFKEFRLNRQFTLKQVANEQVSLAQLSKFERGESDLSLTKFLSALDAINVTMSEFMNKVNSYQRVEQAEVMTRMVVCFYQQDIAGLELLEQAEWVKFQENQENIRPKLNAIMIRGALCQLEATYQMQQSDLDFVSDHLFKVEEWGLDELILVANLASFYPTDLVCRRTREIVRRSEFYQEISKNRYIVEGTLLNTITLCVERGDLDYVPEFDNYMQKILQGRQSQSNRVDYLYTKGFYKHACGDESGIDDMKNAIFCFEVSGNKEKATHYQRHFDQFITKNSQI